LRRIPDAHKPHIIFLQETMGEGCKFISDIENLFWDKEFVSGNSMSHARGLVFGWRRRCLKFTNALSFE
jgi:hypothetical protein